MRVSTDDQAKHGYSLESQDRVLKEYAEAHGLEIVESFVEDESAFTTGRRPEFARMCKVIEKTDVRSILCWKQDRLLRNVTDYAVLIEGLGCTLICATESEVSDDRDMLMGLLRAGMARDESKRISQRARLGLETKARAGLWSGWAPTGYRNEGKGIVPDTSSRLVSRLFLLYAKSSYSLSELETWARGEGLLSRYGTQLTRSSIQRILHDPVYYGVVPWKGTIYPGQHEPLVSKWLWDECQERLHGRAQPREQVHKFPFRGLLTCGRCGCAITASLIKGQYVYYHCTRKKGACSQPFIRAEEMGKILEPAVRGVWVPLTVAEEISATTRRKQSTVKGSARRD